jgi:alpha-tubulin suppressor-like RCC1 family protein
MSDSTVVGWGYNGHGQITIPAGLSGVNAIAAGGSYSLALKSDGTVVGWGSNWYGQITIPAGLPGMTAIAAGGSHSLALKAKAP